MKSFITAMFIIFISDLNFLEFDANPDKNGMWCDGKQTLFIVPNEEVLHTSNKKADYNRLEYFSLLNEGESTLLFHFPELLNFKDLDYSISSNDILIETSDHLCFNAKISEQFLLTGVSPTLEAFTKQATTVEDQPPVQQETLEEFLRDIANAEENAAAREIAIDSSRRPEFTSLFSGMVAVGRFEDETNPDKAKDMIISAERQKEILSGAIESGGVSVAIVEHAALKANQWMNEAYNNYLKVEKNDTGLSPEALDAALKEAKKELSKAFQYDDVLAVDLEKPNGFDDVRVRNMITKELAEVYRGPQDGAETGAFMTGYMFATINPISAVIPRGSQSKNPSESQRMEENFAQAKINLGSLSRDKQLTFLKNVKSQSMRDALAILERCTDGIDDTDISKNDAVLAGALVSLYYQQENRIIFNGVIPERFKVYVPAGQLD